MYEIKTNENVDLSKSIHLNISDIDMVEQNHDNIILLSNSNKKVSILDKNTKENSEIPTAVTFIKIIVFPEVKDVVFFKGTTRSVFYN